MQVERSHLRLHQDSVSGKRERNTLVTHPGLVNNSGKLELIHDIDEGTHVILIESSDGPGEAYVLSASW